MHAELLAFDPRAFSSLLICELSIWFYARHRNFVGLTYFVFYVEFRFRVDADWSRSCTEIAGLWTHVHSFPLAAFDGGKKKEVIKKKRDEDIYEWCSMRLTTHMNASTRNP